MPRQSMNYFVWLAALALPTTAIDAAAPIDATRIRIDVFIASAPSTNTRQPHRDELGKYAITVHRLDGIERFEKRISEGLPADPEPAKSQVLARMKTVDREQTDALQETAESLALAMQYGVERYPAVVFDARWVIYGVANLPAAIRKFQQFQDSRRNDEP